MGVPGNLNYSVNNGTIAAMITKRFTTIFLMLMVLAIFPARAELYMELTQGVNQAIPVAILPFSGKPLMVSGNQLLTDVIRHDLQNSGQFQVTANKFDYVVHGSVVDLGNQHFTVTVQLQSSFSPQDGSSPLLFKKIFQITQANSRQLAHTISNLIYEQLTGVKGIFNTKIAYVLVQRPTFNTPRYALQVADADGFNPQTLLISPQPVMSPAWSPDGHSIAYVSFEDHRAAIYLQNVFTGQRKLLTHFEGINGAPNFSPDGGRLAVVLTKTDNPKIYSYDLASAKFTQLTDGFSIDTEPRWSMDGKNLIFTSDRGGTPQIYQYAFNSGKITRLSYQGNYNAHANLLPDGKTLVMMHRDSQLFGIAKQDLVTGRLQILTATGAEESPSLAPNGKMVLYATKYQGRGVLALISIDGRVKLRLPAQNGSVQEPAWSPYNV